jgi:hypothetical protein
VLVMLASIVDVTELLVLEISDGVELLVIVEGDAELVELVELTVMLDSAAAVNDTLDEGLAVDDSVDDSVNNRVLEVDLVDDVMGTLELSMLEVPNIVEVEIVDVFGLVEYVFDFVEEVLIFVEDVLILVDDILGFVVEVLALVDEVFFVDEGSIDNVWPLQLPKRG